MVKIYNISCRVFRLASSGSGRVKITHYEKGKSDQLISGRDLSTKSYPGKITWRLQIVN